MPTPSPDRKDALLEAGLALSSELTLQVVLSRIVALACALTSARYGALGVLGRNGTISQFVTHGVSESRRAKIGDPPVGRGLLGVLLADPRPLRISDIGADPRSVGFPAHHPPMRSFLGVPVLAHGRLFGNLYLTEKEGAATFTESDQRDLKVLAGQAGVAIANAALYGQAMSRQRWLESSQDINRAILEGRPLPEVLRMAARWAQDLLAADGALIALVENGTRDRLVVRAAVGVEAAGQLLEEEGAQRALRTSGPVSAPAAPRSGVPAPAVFARVGGPQAPLGVVGVFGRPAGLSPEEASALQGVAAQVAVALQYEHAERERRRLALLDERERIARELHDGVIQSLFAVGMGLQAVAVNHPEVGFRVERAVDELDQVIGDLRNYIFGLLPGVLGTRALAEALRHLARELEGRCTIVATVEIEEDAARRLAPRAEDVVQLTREALSNVSRHSGASECRIRLAARGDRAILTVDDDGVGFPAPGSRPTGHGIRNMRARVRRLGGVMSVRSRPGRGATLRMAIPID